MLVTGIFLLFSLQVQLLKSAAIHKTILSNASRVHPAPFCMHNTYCEIAPHYPTEVVQNLVENNPHIGKYVNVGKQVDVLSQADNRPDEESLCVSTEQTIFPKLGMTRNSEWKYIVNHDTFTQSVQIETCLEEDKPCRVIEGFAEGYYTKCKQKYIYRQLLTVTPDGLLSHDTFRFPASCCCHVEFQADKFLRSFNSHD